MFNNNHYHHAPFITCSCTALTPIWGLPRSVLQLSNISIALQLRTFSQRCWGSPDHACGPMESCSFPLGSLTEPWPALKGHWEGGTGAQRRNPPHVMGTQTVLRGEEMCSPQKPLGFSRGITRAWCRRVPPPLPSPAPAIPGDKSEGCIGAHSG